VSDIIWAMDVDGVLNALTDGLHPRADSDDYLLWYTSHIAHETNGRQWTITWSPQMIAELHEVMTDWNISWRWLTTWGSGANGDLATTLGTGIHPVMAEPPWPDPYPRWWKADVIEQALAGDPSLRIVWSDDDLASQWTPDRCQPHLQPYVDQGRLYTISPNPLKGLTTPDIFDVHAWLMKG
jgi:hypothetical protein